jgi:outer membrane protein assembly factor BamB
MKNVALYWFLGLVTENAVATFQPAIAGNPNAEYSTAYQINPAHSGTITFATSFAPPLKQVWRVKFDGAVSYPIVAGGKVFVSVSSSPSGSPLLIALDLQTGKVVWQKQEPVGYLAYDDGRIFFTGLDGPLQAVAAKNGVSFWSAQLPYDVSFNYMPVAALGNVYTEGSGDGTTLYQVNEKTGTIGWTFLFSGRRPPLDRPLSR